MKTNPFGTGLSKIREKQMKFKWWKSKRTNI
jgi:hypothetical protein